MHDPSLVQSTVHQSQDLSKVLPSYAVLSNRLASLAVND